MMEEPHSHEERVKLDSSFTRSRNHRNGLGVVLFGLLFVGVAVGVCSMILSGVGKVATGLSREGVAVLVAGAFGLPGLWVMASGVRAMLARRSADQRRAMHPDEPWLADFVWDEQGINDDGMARLSNLIIGTLLFGAILVPMHWVMMSFGKKSPPMLVWIVFGIFDLIFIAVLWNTLYRVVQRLKYGRSRLRFDRFPMMLGEMLEATFQTPRGIGHCDKITFTLRCVEEVEEIRVSHEKGRRRESKVIVPYRIWSDEFVVDDPGKLDGNAVVPVTFLLPSEPHLRTRLSDYPATYWELDVAAVTPGVDYHAVFLLPVYLGAR